MLTSVLEQLAPPLQTKKGNIMAASAETIINDPKTSVAAIQCKFTDALLSIMAAYGGTSLLINMVAVENETYVRDWSKQ
jgi:hypothetical protein